MQEQDTDDGELNVDIVFFLAEVQVSQERVDQCEGPHVEAEGEKSGDHKLETQTLLFCLHVDIIIDRIQNSLDSGSLMKN